MTSTEIKSRINYKQLSISEHATKRAIERLNRKDKQDALNYTKCLLGNSEYIGEINCEKGNRVHMFVAPNKIQIYLSLDFTCICTLILDKEKPYIVYDKQNKNIDTVKDESKNIFSNTKEIPLQDKLIKLYQIEFKKHDKLEKKMGKEFIEYRLVKNIEIAELNLQIYKTKSNKVKEELSERVKSIELVLASNLIKLKKVQDDKRKISKALSSLLIL